MKLLTTLFVALAAAGGAAAVDQGALLRHGSEKKHLVNEKLVAENTKLQEQVAKTIYWYCCAPYCLPLILHSRSRVTLALVLEFP